MIERLEIKREKTAVEAQLTVAEVPKEKETRKIEQWQNRLSVGFGFTSGMDREGVVEKRGGRWMKGKDKFGGREESAGDRNQGDKSFRVSFHRFARDEY